MDTWGQVFLLIKDECEKTDAPLPEIKATEKYVTVTIHGCKKYMELLKSNTGDGEEKPKTTVKASGIDKEKLTQLLEFCKESKSKKEIMKFMGNPNRSTFDRNIFNPLVESGQILRNRPESPTAPNQKYYTNPDA